MIDEQATHSRTIGILEHWKKALVKWQSYTDTDSTHTRQMQAIKDEIARLEQVVVLEPTHLGSIELLKIDSAYWENSIYHASDNDPEADASDLAQVQGFEDEIARLEQREPKIVRYTDVFDRVEARIKTDEA
jgi:hypothetical protein